MFIKPKLIWHSKWHLPVTLNLTPGNGQKVKIWPREALIGSKAQLVLTEFETPF